MEQDRTKVENAQVEKILLGKRFFVYSEGGSWVKRAYGIIILTVKRKNVNRVG